MRGKDAERGDAASPGDAAAVRAEAPGDAIGAPVTSPVKQFKLKVSRFHENSIFLPVKRLTLSPADIIPRSCEGGYNGEGTAGEGSGSSSVPNTVRIACADICGWGGGALGLETVLLVALQADLSSSNPPSCNRLFASILLS